MSTQSTSNDFRRTHALFMKLSTIYNSLVNAENNLLVAYLYTEIIKSSNCCIQSVIFKTKDNKRVMTLLNNSSRETQNK